MALHRFYESVWEQTVTPPGTLANATTAWVDMTDAVRIVHKVSVGANDRTGVTLQVLQAKDASGTGSKVVTNSVDTSLGGVANKWAAIETAAANLDIGNDFRFVALQITLTGGTATTGTVEVKKAVLRQTTPLFGTDKANIVYNDLQ